jgi:hypothetical protein
MLTFSSRHRSEHVQKLEIRNNNNAAGSQIAKLKAEAKDLRGEIANLQRDIAYYITHLDLAAEGFRVYTCGDDGLRDIRNDQNDTREKTASMIANELYYDWKDDAKFMKEYNSARQYVLKHHRAHERDKAGRGVWAGVLKNELINVDIRRGASITYS